MSALLNLWEAEALGLDYEKFHTLTRFCMRRLPPGVHWGWGEAMWKVVGLLPGDRSINSIRHWLSQARRAEAADRNAMATWLDRVASGTAHVQSPHVELIVPYIFSRLLGLRAATKALPTVWPEYDRVTDPLRMYTEETEKITKHVRNLIITLMILHPGEVMKGRLMELYGYILDFRADWPAADWYETWESDYPELLESCNCCPQ